VTQSRLEDQGSRSKFKVTGGSIAKVVGAISSEGFLVRNSSIR